MAAFTIHPDSGDPTNHSCYTCGCFACCTCMSHEFVKYDPFSTLIQDIPWISHYLSISLVTSSIITR
jgi:hypothetical protein